MSGFWIDRKAIFRYASPGVVWFCLRAVCEREEIEVLGNILQVNSIGNREQKMNPTAELTKLLAVRGSELNLNGAFTSLKNACDVFEVEELESALDALRNNHFDAVLAETSDFLPIERNAASQQAAVVLDTLIEGVCVVGPKGRIIWANQRLRKFSSIQMESVVNICMQAFEAFAASEDTSPGQTKRYSHMVEDGAYFELICSPVFDRKNTLRQIAAVVVDATNRRQQQQTINVIERMSDELVWLDAEYIRNLDTDQRFAILKDRIIQCARDMLDFEHFAIMLLDSEKNKLHWLIADGLAEGVDKTDFLASIEGNGICGYVAATGRSYLCSNVKSDPRYITGLRDAGSSLTVPLRLHGRIVGVFNIESTLPAMYGHSEQHFTEICAHYIALAMHMLGLFPEQAGEVKTPAVQQPVVEPAVNLTGPLSDIVTRATELMEDYIGHDDLRHRLQSLIDMIAQVRGSAHGSPAPSPAVVQAPVDKTPPSADVRIGRPTVSCEDWNLPAPLLEKPVEQPIPARPGVVKRTDPVLNGKRVLVADDEDIIRKLISDILTPCGCVVDLAPDGQEAIANLRENDYDLIITDVNMPGASGYDVLQAAAEGEKQTPVILITGFGYDPNHAILRACQAGQARTLFKPFKVIELLEVSRAAVLQTV